MSTSTRFVQNGRNMTTHHRLHASVISEHLLEIPVEQLRRIAQTEGVNSIERETKHFSCTALVLHSLTYHA
ncbi:unnamed protein product [Anisakis simplex]|uniref:Transposase n=1 Tax=Anisakis simplex TaxID=6269 RepID=A0A0M3JLU3_ANISI|nr:unnamed protein product [Anisakis simplex]